MRQLSAQMSLILKMTDLQARISKRLDSGMGSIHGISFTEYMVMHRINEAPGKLMRRIDLAESIGLSASGITRMLRPMQKIGLVEKEENPRDARVSLVKLSKAGNKILSEASLSFEQSAESITQALSGKQIQELSKLIDCLN